MMRTLPGVRFVETRRGDTLQRVAARELGDAARWRDLAEINQLSPPYLTDEVAEASQTVLLTGALLMVPAASPRPPKDGTPEEVLGADVALRRGELQVVGGDLALVAGVPNFAQALSHLVQTEPGDLLFHARYGAGVRRLLGSSNSRSKGVLAAGLVRGAARADPRTSAVTKATAEVRGDVLRLEVEVEAVTGGSARVVEAF